MSFLDGLLENQPTNLYLLFGGGELAVVAMSEDEKATLNDIPLSEIDLPKEVIESEEGSGADKDKALIAFDPLQRYLAEIRRFSLLSREEEHRLAVDYKEYGNVEAAYKLVTANLRLVVMIAREYQKAFKNLLDLIQEGNMGLMEAVKNFDPYRGVRFPSYAVWWIRAYMIRHIMNDWRMVIGTTQAQRKLFFNLQKEKEKLEAEGLTPGPKLLAQRLNVKEDEVVEMEQRLASRDLSVDMPMGMMRRRPYCIFSGSEGVAGRTDRRDPVPTVVAQEDEEFAGALKDKELVIFRERLLNEEPLTLREIGKNMISAAKECGKLKNGSSGNSRLFLGRSLKTSEAQSPEQVRLAGFVFGPPISFFSHSFFSRDSRPRHNRLYAPGKGKTQFELRVSRTSDSKNHRLGGGKSLQFEKEVEILAPKEKVWNFIWDVDRFIACVPGCKEAKTIEAGKLYWNYGREGGTVSR